jgi:glycosyltransferase involved in cell wall biosynthesis
MTIGIPFYNAEAYLGDAIRSIFAQTYHDWELILVDDGSTDRSLEIARAVRDPRVRVISDGQNRRLPYRLNQITAEARTDFLGRMDADDLTSPSRFEKEMAFLSEHTEIDLVSTGVCSITNDKRPIGVRSIAPGRIIDGRSLLLGHSPIMHPAILGRRVWFQRNPYDASVDRIEDYELWLRAYSKNDLKVHVMSEPLFYYREEENVTARRLLTVYAGQRRLYSTYAHLGFKSWGIPFLTTRSFCKALIVLTLSACNRMDLLLTRRNIPIDDKNLLEHFTREIEQISQTRVPGLD